MAQIVYAAHTHTHIRVTCLNAYLFMCFFPSFTLLFSFDLCTLEFIWLVWCCTHIHIAMKFDLMEFPFNCIASHKIYVRTLLWWIKAKLAEIMNSFFQHDAVWFFWHCLHNCTHVFLNYGFLTLDKNDAFDLSTKKNRRNWTFDPWRKILLLSLTRLWPIMKWNETN